MKSGDSYVVLSDNILLKLPDKTCNDNEDIKLDGLSVEKFYLINGQFVSSNRFVYADVSNNSYVCHVYNEGLTYNPSFILFPAVVLVVLFFSVIFRWFYRLRG